MRPHLATVNAGRVAPLEQRPAKRSAIHKRPVEGAVRVGPLGLEVDEIGDHRHHGGVDQAVYAYAAEDLAWFSEQTGLTFAPGGFGENLTTQGVDVTGALIGERWRIGTTLLEVCSVRTPCRTFATFVGEKGWVKTFTAAARPGAYLRVIEPGTLTAGDEIEVVARPDHDVTVGTVFRALHLERDLLPRLLDAPALCDEARAKAQKYVATTER